MRSSELVAAVAVVAMTVPAFLVVPALGLWYVAKIWPGMSLVDRTIFCRAVGVVFVSASICFRGGIRRIEQGRSEVMTAGDRILLIAPILAGGWALTHRLDTGLFMVIWALWDAYRARRRQRETSPR